jgi:5-methylcytosine-specific restriction protein A
MDNPEIHTVKWKRVRLAILRRDEYRCQIQARGCKQVATTVDHITPRSEGGAMFDPANLRAACTKCNYGRYHPAKFAAQQRRRGWTYRTSTAPTTTRL